MTELLWIPALVPLTLTTANVMLWPRGRVGARLNGRVTALVPARNEAQNIDACLAALLNTTVNRVMVLDDASTDDTAERVRHWATRDARVVLRQGLGPAPGWMGKAAACEALRVAAGVDAPGDQWLLFVDADVRVRPDICERLGEAGRRVDLLSAVPQQQVQTFTERLGLPMLHLTYCSWLVLPWIRWSTSPAVLAANGQVVLARSEALVALGGFGIVRGEVVDDMALMRAARRAGLRVDFLDGTDLATCRMYRSGRELLDGFSKNLYPGIGANPLALIAVLLVYTLCFLLPWVAWPAAPVALVGVVANLLQRWLIAWRFRYPKAEILIHPLGVLLFCWVALRSAWWTTMGTIMWRGRPVPA